MNNYCTNCGKKLEPNEIKCSECNTYIIDTKYHNKKKVLTIIFSIIGFIIFGIIAFTVGYNIYYKSLNKTIYNNYLKDKYPNAEYISYTSCIECTSDCDGSCMNDDKVVGCYIYNYKGDANSEYADVAVFYNRGEVSIDNYSYIIHKYGYKEESNNVYYNDNFEKRYQYVTSKRYDLNIYIVDSTEDDLTNAYNMVNELIEASKENTSANLCVDINFYGDIDKDFRVTNEKDINHFEWIIYGHTNDIILNSPTLEEFKEKFDIPSEDNIEEIETTEENND